MRCAACNAENPPKATACAACGAALARKGRRRGVVDEIESPFGPLSDGPNRRALVAYRCAVVGLIPMVGLVAGPLACLFGCHAWLRDRKEAGFTAVGPLHASIVLGGLVALTNWVGVTLMVLGANF